MASTKEYPNKLTIAMVHVIIYSMVDAGFVLTVFIEKEWAAKLK